VDTVQHPVLYRSVGLFAFRSGNCFPVSMGNRVQRIGMVLIHFDGCVCRDIACRACVRVGQRRSGVGQAKSLYTEVERLGNSEKEVFQLIRQ